jgi:hypothetical protein
LLVSIFKAEKELPENKTELYSKCIEYIARKREKDKNRLDYDFELINTLMNDNTLIEIALLAFPNNKEISEQDIYDKLLNLYKERYIDENKARNAIQEFLHFCTERTELIVATNEL